MYMNAEKLINQKNYFTKNKKIREMKSAEIKKKLQEDQSSH
jgi:hypothetical protein